MFLGDIIFCGKRKYTYILSNNTSDILIGTKLLDRKILTINFLTKKVVVEEA